jgi:hypothetical protein
VGFFCYIRLSIAFGQLVNITLTHIALVIIIGNVAKDWHFVTGPGLYAARARALPYPSTAPSPARISANAAESDSQNRITG